MVLRRELLLCSSSFIDEAVLGETKAALNARSESTILKNPSDPYYLLVKEFQNVVCHNPPSVLPPDRGVRHESDLVSGTKYCVTRQWPLPKEQCDVIDEFFRVKHATGMVRESKSPHSSVIDALYMLITSLMQPLFPHKLPFLVRMLFRTIWSAVPCTAPST